MYKKSLLALVDFNILTGEWDSFDFSNRKVCYGKGSGSSGGGGTTNETVTNNSSPPPEVTAAYEQALSQAQSAASQPLQQYQGQIVAPLNSTENSAFNTINNAQGIANPYINAAAGLIGQGTQPLWSGVQQFSPSAVQQYQSPYTQSVLQTTQAAEQNQDAQQQAALQGNTISSGAWGGDRAGVASAILSGQQDIANNATNANIENTGYNTALGEFNTQQQAQLGANEANSYLAQQGAFGLGNLGNEALGTSLTGANDQLAAGQLQQQQTQSQLNVPYEQFLQQQAYPFQTAQYYANIAEGIGSNSGGTGSGTGSTTSPSPSTASQIGGTALGLGSLGYLGYLAFGKGGRIGGKELARGGIAKGYDVGGQVQNEIPDLSISYVPSVSPIHGAGPPKVNIQPPKANPTGNPIGQGENSALTALGIGAKLNAGSGGVGDNMGAFGGNSILDPGMSNAVDVGGEINPLDTFTEAAEGSDFKRGGMARPRRYDVGGATPLTAQTSSQQQPTQSSQLNNLTPQQLQNILIRLPQGSPQAAQAQAVLQQKRMLPNVGAQAQGGFGQVQSQIPAPMAQPQQPGMARGGRMHFDDGGNVPNPPTPDAIQRQLELQSEVNADTPDAAQEYRAANGMANPPIVAQRESMGLPTGSNIPMGNPPISGGMGNRQMVASATPPSYPEDEESDTTPKSNHRDPNPWLALAAAGFGMAAGTSPYAAVNLGRGALEGIQNYGQQQKESDTVNDAADKLMQEAKQHKDSIAIEQQRADQEGAKPIPDGMGGFLVPNPKDPTHPGRITGPFDTPATTTASTGTPLTGDAYLATINPRVASLAKQIGDNTIQVTPYMMTKGDPLTKAAIAAAKIYNPDWSEAAYSNIQKFNTDPNGGVKVKSLNTVVPHLQMLSDLTDAMKTGDVTAINAVKNKLATDFGVTFDNGVSDAANLKAAQQLVGNEIINSTIAQGRSGGALGDREEIAKNLNNADNPDILRSNIQKVYFPAIRAQANATEKYYQTNTGQKDFKTNRLLPETTSALYGQQTSQGSTSASGPTTWTRVNGKLVPASQATQQPNGPPQVPQAGP